MKESDTPLGKAYAKAKGAGAPPPPPPPPPAKGAGGENDDVLTRRYKTVTAQVPNDKNNEFTMLVTYDNVNNGFKIRVKNNKTKKTFYEEPFAQINDAKGKAPITAAIGRAITSLSRNNQLVSEIDKDDMKALYDYVLNSIEIGEQSDYYA